MGEYLLHGENMTDAASMHDELQRCFSFPAYYGRNLDALWDILTESDEPKNITLMNPEAMPQALFSGLVGLFLELCRAQEDTSFELASDALRPGLYRHFKGREYRLLHIALHSETLEPMVVYQAMYGARGIWVRPASMWSEFIVRNGVETQRFTRIGDS